MCVCVCVSECWPHPQGLKVGDKVAEFGSVTAANFTGLRNVADVVQHSVGVGGSLSHTHTLTHSLWHSTQLYLCLFVCVCVATSTCGSNQKGGGSLSLTHSPAMARPGPPRVSPSLTLFHTLPLSSLTDVSSYLHNNYSLFTRTVLINRHLQQ